MKLLDVCVIKNDSVNKFDGYRNYIATGDVENNKIINQTIVDYKNKPSRANIIIQENDVIFAKMQNTIKVIVGNKENSNYIFSTGFMVLKPNHNIRPKYLYYYLNSDIFNLQKDKNCRGATQKAINNKEMKKIDIKDIPELEKQDLFIKKMDSISEMIELKKNESLELNNLVESKFIEMFGDPITNSKKIQTKKLGEICNICRGASPRPINDYLNGSVPWIKIGDATNGDNYYLNSTKEKITESGAKKSRFVKKGSLIFANCGVSLGFARIITFDGCIHDGWLAFDDFEHYLHPIFFLKSLNFCTEYFRKIAPGGTQPNLNTNIMKKFDQITPNMNKQLEYISIVNQVDKQKNIIEKEIKELDNLYNSLMQEYFG